MSEKPFTVMVTGGAGYIGSHAVLALLDAGWPVVVVDNLVTGFRWAVPDEAVFVQAEVGQTETMIEVIREHGVGAILHFAGSIVVPESVSDPLKYYRNNTVASRALLEAAVTAGVKHFIFSSTAATYGIPDQVPIREDAPKQPINPYGTSKLMTELMLRDTAAAHPIAQRILERVASVRVTGFGEPIGLTCSIGVATSDMLGVWGEHLIAKADAAVYQAKRSGRNRVEVARPLAA